MSFDAPSPTPRRCAIYLRVSEDDGNKEGNSIDVQRDSCLSWINYQRTKGNPVELVGEFVELGVSAKNLERPKLKTLLALAKSKAVNLIVVYKIDRLSRSLLDFCKLAEVFKTDGTELVSTTQDLDSSTSQGRLLVNILMTFAQYERELIVERTLATMRKRARDGKWNGQWLPFGYDHLPKEKSITPNAEEAKHVAKVFDLVLAGERPERIAKFHPFRRKPRAKFPSSKERLLDANDIRRIVEKPVYAGLNRVGNELVPALHKAIVSRAIWEQANLMLKSCKPSRVGVIFKKHKFLLNGVLHCGCCDAPMTGYQTGGRRYYACQRHRRGGGAHACEVRNLPVAAIDDFVCRLLGEIVRIPEVADAFVQIAKTESSKHEDSQRDHQQLATALDEILSQRKRIKEELKISKTAAGRREWRSELEDSFEREKALRVEIAAVSRQLNDDADAAVVREQIIKALGRAGEFVRSLSEEARDQFLRTVIRRIVVNVPEAKAAENSPSGIVFSAPVEKGAYLLNVQFLVSSLASMLSEHCAEDSTELGKWLPGLGSNQRPSD